MIINNVADEEPNSMECKFMCGIVEGFYGRPWTSEQRKKLFQRMNKMGMDTYLYAPKDDCKHRMYWRDLYTVEEADHLTTLVEAAIEEDVAFVYALSPGLDMSYSSAKEVSCLKRKLEQVASFGCKAFAILFDDIDVDMCEGDKAIFQSMAQAQVSVTNEVFQHLGQPEKFLFCPTEYCAARAVPTVATSEYLITIGSKLLSGIDVMWTGSKVIPKKISIKSVEEVTKVLKRPPVIWDNIVANDYDQRRLFLGPYDGRSSELIPYLRGVMLNPNCEFEANYIAMYTLAQWSKSNADGMKKDFNLSENPVSADIKLETEGDYSTDDDIPLHLQSLYQPKLALSAAIKDWMQIFYDECTVGSRKLTMVPPPITVPAIASTDIVHNDQVNESYMQPCTLTVVNSLIDNASESEGESGIESLPEPMDCAASTSGASTCSSVLTTDSTELDPIFDDKQTVVAIIDGSSSSTLTGETDPCHCSPDLKLLETDVETMQVDPDSFTINPNPIPSSCLATATSPIISPCSPIDASSILNTTVTDPLVCSSETIPQRLTEKDVHEVVQLFYMPFEHGTKSVHLLNEFHWLKSNALCLCEATNKHSTPEERKAAEEWHTRAQDFKQSVEDIDLVLNKFCDIPNKALLYDIFPYLWDICVVLNQLHTFISWLAVGQIPISGSAVLLGSPYSWSNVKFREHFSSGEQEPWVFRGGLQAEFQRMLPLEGSADLLLMACPPSPALKLARIRPYMPTDEAAVYEICRRTCDDGVDGTEIFPDQPDLIGDKLVGSFLNISPQLCFIMEDELGVFGYALAVADAKDYHNKLEMAWIPAMKEKYPKPIKDVDHTPAEEIILGFHNHQNSLPPILGESHPAIVRMDILSDRVHDQTVTKRAMSSIVTAVKLYDVPGVHAEIHVGDHNTSDFYSKLAFINIPLPNGPRDDLVYMGRLI